jgi:hypothetical protein
MTTFLGKAGIALAVGGIFGAGTAAGFGIASAVSDPHPASFASSADPDPAALDSTALDSAALDLAALGPGALGPGALGSAAPEADQPRGRYAHPRAGEYPGLRRLLLRRVEHGEVTLKGKDDKPVVVDIQRGKVTAVSPTSISLKSEDGFTATYTVSSDTRIRVDGERKAIGDVRVGKSAGLIATKASTAAGSAATARFVVVR